MPFILPQKVYEIIRWVVSIVLPALIVFYGIVAGELNLPYTESVIKIATAFEMLLGTIFCISKLSYDSKKDTDVYADLESEVEE